MHSIRCCLLCPLPLLLLLLCWLGIFKTEFVALPGTAVCVEHPGMSVGKAAGTARYSAAQPSPAQHSAAQPSTAQHSAHTPSATMLVHTRPCCAARHTCQSVSHLITYRVSSIAVHLRMKLRPQLVKQRGMLHLYLSTLHTRHCDNPFHLLLHPPMLRLRLAAPQSLMHAPGLQHNSSSQLYFVKPSAQSINSTPKQAYLKL